MIAPYQALASTGLVAGDSVGANSKLSRAKITGIPAGLRDQRLYVGFAFDATAPATVSSSRYVSATVSFADGQSKSIRFEWRNGASLASGLPSVRENASAVVPPCAIEYLSTPAPNSPGVIPRIADEMLALCELGSGLAYLRMFPLPIEGSAREISVEFDHNYDADPGTHFIGFVGLRGNA